MGCQRTGNRDGTGDPIAINNQPMVFEEMQLCSTKNWL